jgi:hypothetical protein
MVLVNMKNYEPELGQAAFGQPTQQFECPEYIEALLKHLADELGRVVWNNTQKEYPSPFENTGNKFKSRTFKVEAYSWDEDAHQQYNFKWKDVEISWYKYLGRGMSINKELTPGEAVEMFDDCLASIRKMEEKK